MSDFKFRLATLLRLREAARNERRQAMAAARRDEELIERQLNQLHVEWEHIQSITRQAACPGAVDVGRLIETHRYQKSLEIRRDHVSKQLAAAKTEVEHRREGLLEADRDVRTLEKLRDAQRMRHHQESHRLEVKRIDEATQLRVAIGNESQTMNLAGTEYHV